MSGRKLQLTCASGLHTVLQATARYQPLHSHMFQAMALMGFG